MADGIRTFMEGQRQCTQLILTDNRSVFTYRFQLIQRLQPNFTTDCTRNFMCSMHKGDSSKLRISSFIPQQQQISFIICPGWLSIWVSEAVVKVSMSCTALLSLSLGDQFDYSELKSPTRIEYVGCCLLIPKSTCRWFSK